MPLCARLVRVHWTNRKLLEWKTSSEAERSTRADLRGFFRTMFFAPALATVMLVWLAVQRVDVLAIAGPWLGVWIASPLIAWWLSRPLAQPAIRLTDKQRMFLRHLSRKTWRYFETFVTAEENWLPPDNVQVNSEEVVASRTSPTNIGMALLADLAAYDFGYCSVARLLDRTQSTFDTLTQMERYRGHFFNWYNTRTLAPLTPRYVSTVDSGNLAGHLLVLGSGLRKLMDSEILPRRVFDGLRDTLGVLLEEARGGKRVANEGSVPQIDSRTFRTIERQIEELERRSYSLSSAVGLLPRLIDEAAEMREHRPPTRGAGMVGRRVRACECRSSGGCASTRRLDDDPAAAARASGKTARRSRFSD